MAFKTLELELTQACWDTIKAQALSQNITEQEVIEKAIVLYLDHCCPAHTHPPSQLLNLRLGK